jgi:hypothetical protein
MDVYVIPEGWIRICEGRCLTGDKYWSDQRNAWLPCAGQTMQGAKIENLDVTVIRKEER